MVHIHNGIQLSRKKNKIIPFTATWMQLEITTLSKSERERQIPYDITYMWTLKYGANESIYTTEADSDMQNRLVVAKRERGGRGMDWGFGVSRCKLLHLEWINTSLLSLLAKVKCRMDKQVPTVEHRELYPISWDRPGWKIIFKKQCTYICMTESLYCAAEIGTTLLINYTLILKIE